MPIHIYECNKEKVEELKKLLSYDPYLDPNLIPYSRELKPGEKLSQEEIEEGKQRERNVQENLKKLKEDEYSNIIFARQEYELFDGLSIDLDDKKYYLYLKANDEFLEKADKLLDKKLGIKRANKDVELKVINYVEKEHESANIGFGSIFGTGD